MQLDGVVVRTIEGKSELRHRECVGVDAIENDSPVFRHPLRNAVRDRARLHGAEGASPNLHLLRRDHSRRGVSGSQKTG